MSTEKVGENHELERVPDFFDTLWKNLYKWLDQIDEQWRLNYQKWIFLKGIVFSYFPIIWYFLMLKLNGRLNYEVWKNSRVYENPKHAPEEFLKDALWDARNIELWAMNRVLNPAVTSIVSWVTSSVLSQLTLNSPYEIIVPLITTAIVTIINMYQSKFASVIGWEDFKVSQKNGAETLIAIDRTTIQRSH
jgi:hypothetical protein